MDRLSIPSLLAKALLVGIGVILGIAGVWSLGLKEATRVPVPEDKVRVLRARQDFKKYIKISPLAEMFESVEVLKDETPPNFVPAEEKAKVDGWWLTRGLRTGEILANDEVIKSIGGLYIGPPPGPPFHELVDIRIDLFPPGALVDLACQGENQQERVIARRVRVLGTEAPLEDHPSVLLVSLDLDKDHARQLMEMKVLERGPVALRISKSEP